MVNKLKKLAIGKLKKNKEVKKTDHYRGGVVFPLGLLSIGERAEIVNVRSKSDLNGNEVECVGKGRKKSKRHCRAEDMGLRAGGSIEVLNKNVRGPLLVKVNDSRIAIARGMAMKIKVKRYPR